MDFIDNRNNLSTFIELDMEHKLNRGPENDQLTFEITKEGWTNAPTDIENITLVLNKKKRSY